MTKSSPSGVERDLKASINGFHDRARAVKEAHRTQRQAIFDDPLTSDLAKRNKLEALDKETRTKLDGIKTQQESYVRGLRDKVERELVGNQPTDANSVLLRRDAADRVRKIAEEREALDILNDAVRNGDDSLAHAIGHRGRQSGWVDVLDAYQAAHPQSADSAVALAFVEEATSGAAYNVASQIAYADPTA